MKNIFLFLLITILQVFTFYLYSQNLTLSDDISNDSERGFMEVSKDGHSMCMNGKPFFWLGDTGWGLVSLSPEQVDMYFKDRAANQFNIIRY